MQPTETNDKSTSGQPVVDHPIAAAIRQAAADRRMLRLVRNATEAVSEDAATVDMSQFAGIVDYPARDMTITVEAGMPVGQLAEILKTERQQLPIDARDSQQTIGSLVAGNHSGPRRYGYGTIRDYLIGIEAVDGRGRVFHAGGRVVKNVAGYDLCRLMIGSHGRLGVLTKLTWKLKPLPPQSRLLIASFSAFDTVEDALSRLNTTDAQPVILDLLNRVAAASILANLRHTVGSSEEMLDAAAVLVIGVEGTAEVCEWQVETIRHELDDLADSVCVIDAPDATEGFCAESCLAAQPGDDDEWLYRLDVLPSAVASTMAMLKAEQCSVFGRAGNGCLFVRFSPARFDEDDGSSVLRSDEDDGSGVRSGELTNEERCFEYLTSIATEQAGHLIVLKSSKFRSAALAPETRRISDRLIATMDPDGVLGGHSGSIVS